MCPNHPHFLHFVYDEARQPWGKPHAGSKISQQLDHVAARMGYEAQAAVIQDRYLAGDKRGAIAAVPTAMVEDIALIGPWAKIADEIQRWRQTVITTFSVSTDLRHLERVAGLLRR